MLIKDLDKYAIKSYLFDFKYISIQSQFLHIHGSPAYDNDLLEIYDEFCYLHQLSLQQLSLKNGQCRYYTGCMI